MIILYSGSDHIVNFYDETENREREMKTLVTHLEFAEIEAVSTPVSPAKHSKKHTVNPKKKLQKFGSKFGSKIPPENNLSKNIYA